MTKFLKAHNNRYEQRRNRTVYSVIGGVIIALAVAQLLMPHFLPALFTTVVRPFWRFEFAVSGGSLSSPETLLNENEELRRQILELTVNAKSQSAILAENNDLKVLLDRKGVDLISTSTVDVSTSTEKVDSVKPPFKIGTRILAPVLMHPPLAAYDELIIDGGADMGFSVGDKVYGSPQFVIGLITDVLGQTSKVTLLTSPGQKYEIAIGASHSPAFATGRGGGQYAAELPRIIDVKEGDMVTTASLNDKPFGIVVRVMSEPSQAFKTIIFAPPVNVYELRWVLVEPKNKTNDQPTKKN